VVVSGKSSATLSVEEIMTPESVLKTVTPGDTVLAAMELMIENNFRHVPVVCVCLTSKRTSVGAQ
jgi:CBS domain-containing protein